VRSVILSRRTSTPGKRGGRDLEEHVGLAGPVERTPAGKVLAGELAAGGGDQLGMLLEVLAVQGDGLGAAVIGHAVGVAPAGRAGDDGAGWFAPALGAAELARRLVMAVISWW
jgi:hypothetical protein